MCMHNANFNTTQIPTFSICVSYFYHSFFNILNPSFSNCTARVLHWVFRRILLFICIIVVDTTVPGLADRNFLCSLQWHAYIRIELFLFFPHVRACLQYVPFSNAWVLYHFIIYFYYPFLYQIGLCSVYLDKIHFYCIITAIYIILYYVRDPVPQQQSITLSVDRSYAQRLLLLAISLPHFVWMIP